MAPTLPAVTKGTPPSAPPPLRPRRKRKRKRTRKPPPQPTPTPTPPSAEAPEAELPPKNRSPAPSPERGGPPPPATTTTKKKKKKHVPFRRAWCPEDEVRILEVLAALRRALGRLPQHAELVAALRGRLDRTCAADRHVVYKRQSLLRRWENDSTKSAPPADDHERRLYILSQGVWGPGPPSAGERAIKDAAQAQSAGERAGNVAPAPKAKTLVEMRELYPWLVDDAMLRGVDPGVLHSVLPGIDHGKAEALNSEINNFRNEVTKAIAEWVGEYNTPLLALN
ncbi:hypothetical protein ACP4OV_016681 [Aristida adscensionis]